MAKKGKTYLADIEFTDAEVLEKFGFPCIFILQDDSGKIIKQIAYDSTGNKSVTTFSGSDPDKVLTLGTISATTTSITLGLHSSGENKVKFSGQILSRNVEQMWSFPAVVGQQIFQIYAIDDADVFHLALPGEEIPEGALLVRSLTLTEDGELAEIDADFNLRAENAWRQYTIPNNDPFIIQMDNSLAARFEIKLAVGVTAPKIGLVRQKAGKSFWNGSEFTFWNNSDIDIELIEETYTDTIFKNLTFEPATIKAGNYAQIFEKAGVLVVGKFSPEIDLSPYALDVDLDAEVVNRTMADALKLDKPLTPNNTAERLISADGSTTAKSNYQRNKQFFVSLPATVSEDWKGCIVFFTSSGNLTVPIGLTADFTFNGVVDNGVTLTPAITGPMAWLGTAPTAFSGVSIFTMVRRDGTNNFQILGV